MSLKRKSGEALPEAKATAKKPKANSSITAFFNGPKEAPFDKAAWVAKLTPEQKELLQLEINTLHDSWLAQLKDDVLSKEFLDLKRFLKREKDAKKTIFPPLEDVYSWYVVPHAPPSWMFQRSLTGRTAGPATRPSTRSRS